eukprot:scaffold3362_cov402-Prasinococcus_capsulatus_cf.AAC.23
MCRSHPSPVFVSIYFASCALGAGRCRIVARRRVQEVVVVVAGRMLSASSSVHPSSPARKPRRGRARRPLVPAARPVELSAGGAAAGPAYRYERRALAALHCGHCAPVRPAAGETEQPLFCECLPSATDIAHQPVRPLASLELIERARAASCDRARSGSGKDTQSRR